MELLQPQKPPEPHLETLNSPENPSSHSLPKKTRDLPNLTECHSCGFKVDVCSGGKNALRTLYSEWRVVLLCNKCFYKVKSSQICSYCFSLASSQECFRCMQCRNSVHKNCFFKHKDTAPWSYACLESEFSVCVDCWIPKPLANNRRRMRKVRGGRIEKKGGVLIEKGNFSGGGNLVRSTVDGVNDANRGVEKKVKSDSGGREEVVKKAVVAKRAVEKANNALSLVAKPNREDSSRNPRRRKMDALKVFDGSELTFELHPYISCSPRISKSCHLLNTGYLGTSKRRVSSDDSSCKTSNSGSIGGFDEDEVSGDDKLNEDSDKSSFDSLVSVESSDSDSSTDLNNLCKGRSDAEIRSKDEEELLKEGEDSCSDRLINFAGEDSGLELDRKQADSVLHGEERCNGQRDRYFLKYKRKKYRLKTNIDSKLSVLHNKTGEPFSYSRVSKDDERISELNVKEDLLKEGEGSCSYRLLSFGGEYSGLELDRKQPDSALFGEERCNGPCDRYFLKYSRKKYGLKTNVDSRPRILHDKIEVPFSCSRISKDDEVAVSNVEEELLLKEGERNCSYRLINLGGEHSGLELDRKQADSTLGGEERCNGQYGRFFMKYRRQKYRLKTNVDNKHEVLHDKIGISFSRSWESKDNDRKAELDVRKELLKEGDKSGSYPLINFGEEDSMGLDCKQADSAFHGEERCNGQRDRYLLKYRRRLCRLKTSIDSKLQALHEKIYLENQGSTVGVSFSCSRESNVSSQSFHAPLHSSACEHGYISESHTLEGNREHTML